MSQQGRPETSLDRVLERSEEDRPDPFKVLCFRLVGKCPVAYDRRTMDRVLMENHCVHLSDDFS